MQRWALRLSQFDYEVQYVRGVDMLNSDCMSRLPLSETVPINEPQEVIFTITMLNSMPISCHEIMTHTNSDPVLLKLKGYSQKGQWQKQRGIPFDPSATVLGAWSAS